MANALEPGQIYEYIGDGGDGMRVVVISCKPCSSAGHCVNRNCSHRLATGMVIRPAHSECKVANTMDPLFSISKDWCLGDSDLFKFIPSEEEVENAHI